MHPLVSALRATDLRNPSPTAVDRILRAANQGGATPAERQRLADVERRYAGGWSGATRDAWQRGVSRMTPGPTMRVRPSSGPEAEDLSSRMKTVWMPGFSDPIQAVYTASMARLGAELGFHLVASAPPSVPMASIAGYLTRATGLPVERLDQIVDVVREDEYSSVWGEDRHILTNATGMDPVKVLVPPRISDSTFNKAIAFTQDEGYHPYHPGFQGAVSDRNESVDARLTARQLGREVVNTASYIEGGNLLGGTTSDGKPYALIGRDSLVVSTFHLENAFDPRDVDATMRRMQQSGQLTQRDIDATAQKLANVDRASSWWAPTSVTREHYARAPEFLAKMELTKQVIAHDMDLTPDRVAFVTQPEFHIDMHMRPLAPGEVMVQHPRVCIDLIDQALSEPGIQRWEAQELHAMRENASQELRSMGHVYDQIVQEVEDAGLLAIPSPGVFSGYRLANFMNAVPGTSDRDETYLLTNASTIKPLERAFARFVKDLGVDRVEFIGGEGGGPRSLSASEQSLELAGGLDCREVDHQGERRPTNDLTAALRGWV